MEEFLKWTLERIRANEPYMNWMEERRLEWTPLVASALNNLINGYTFIVATDSKREWFGKYILDNINSGKDRPYLPFVLADSLVSNIDELKSSEQMSLFEDMLDMTFPNGYLFFYVGCSNNIKSKISKRANESFIWLFDEHLQDSFFMNSNDINLDTKLIQMYKLFDESLDALLFAQVDLSS